MRWFRELSVTARVMCRSLAVLYPVLLIIGLAVMYFLHPFEPPLAFAVGLLAGSALSAFKVVLLEQSLTRSLDMEGKGAKDYANLQMTLRYFLTVAVLVLAVFFRQIIGLFGTVAGIIALQPAAYITTWRIRKLSLDPPAPPPAEE